MVPNSDQLYLNRFLPQSLSFGLRSGSHLNALIGIGRAKIVGLELFKILQLAYFTLLSHGSLDIEASY